MIRWGIRDLAAAPHRRHPAPRELFRAASGAGAEWAKHEVHVRLCVRAYDRRQGTQSHSSTRSAQASSTPSIVTARIPEYIVGKSKIW